MKQVTRAFYNCHRTRCSEYNYVPYLKMYYPDRIYII